MGGGGGGGGGGGHKEVAKEQLNVSIKGLGWFEYFCCQILKVFLGLDFLLDLHNFMIVQICV